LRFCSKKRDADGFQFTIEEIVPESARGLKPGHYELHIVGGLHPSLPFSYYTDMLKGLKALDTRLQLKCFTAIEILHLAWLAKKSTEETLRELKAAGLDSLTGGGAEIFRPAVRSAIAKAKKPPRSICRFIEHGTIWEDAALARCYTGTLNRSPTELIIWRH
jgi:aminodeoxyfutalosine synthase